MMRRTNAVYVTSSSPPSMPREMGPVQKHMLKVLAQGALVMPRDLGRVRSFTVGWRACLNSLIERGLVTRTRDVNKDGACEVYELARRIR
jgi:hypothetical protein